MIPKTILVAPDLFAGNIPLTVSVSGALTTDIPLAGTVPVTVSVSGLLTTGILLVATIHVDVGLSGPLFAAKKGRALASCGHPMFTKCDRTHLGEDS